MTQETKTRGHESRDVDVSRLARAVLVLLAVWAVIHVGVWWFYQDLRTRDERRDVSPSLVEAAPPVPPEPRLQVDPKADLQEYLRNQQQLLSSYGWVSRAEGKVRIPINRAMELIVERGKPR